MEYSEVTYATRECNGGEMVTIEFADGSTSYVEFVATDYLAETITVLEDGGTATFTTGELSDITVGNDY